MNIITSEVFKGRFFRNLPSSFRWQNTPLQIYSLKSFSDYLTLPTPLLKPDYNYFIYIQKGCFTQQIGLNKIVVNGPSMVYISAGTIISLDAISNEMEGYFLLIEDKTLSSFLKKGSALHLLNIFPVVELCKKDSDWINNLCKLLEGELTIEIPNPEINHGLLHALLYKLLDLSETNASHTRSQEIAIRFKQLVYSCFKEHKSSYFYARKLNISENYLNRCVKEVFNRNTKEFILQVTILNSQFLLWDLTKTISEVCYELNFDDPSYFSRLFKRITNTTPTQFRNSIMHDLS
ncbi:helix-turn-helix domain-containing protein [Chryseobacterium sp. M5A1_1a]